MKNGKIFLSGLIVIIVGLFCYYYFIERCKRDKVICPDGTTKFSHRCPENLYKEYVKDTEIGFDLELNSVDSIVDAKFKDVLIKEERKQISEKYNQHTTRLNHALKSAFYAWNSDPCNTDKSNEMASIREQAISSSTYLEELAIKLKSNRNSDSLINKSISELDKPKPVVNSKPNYSADKYLVAFYGNNTPEKKFNGVEKYLNSNFNVIGSKNLSNKPKWFAQKSTVFYYSEKSKSEAIRLAKHLNKITGDHYTVTKGAGLGVPGDSREKSLRIHSVN